MSNKKGQKVKKTTDYDNLENVYHTHLNLSEHINEINPNTMTCNRLMNHIYCDNSNPPDVKIASINIIINYIESKYLKKDKAFYNIMIKCLTLSNNADKQKEIINEMEASDIKLKVGTYLPVLESYSNKFKETKDPSHYNNLFITIDEIIAKKFDLTEEVFIIIFDLFKYMTQYTNINIEIQVINIIKLMSYYIDIISVNLFKSYMDFMNCHELLENTEFKVKYRSDETHGLTQRQLHNDVYTSLKDDWIRLFEEDSIKDVKSKKKPIDYGYIFKKTISRFEFYNKSKKFLHPDKKTVLIDGANIGFAVNRGRGDNHVKFFRQIDAFAQYFHKKGWNVVIFLYHTRFENIKDSEISDIIQTWRQPEMNIFTHDVRGCNDDYIWMLAGFYYNSVLPNHDVFILTNDIMRNDNIEHLNQKELFQFQKNHQITYDIKYQYDEKLGYDDSPFNIEVNMPLSYSHYTQIFMENDCYIIYVPYVNYEIKKNERDVKMSNFTEKIKKECQDVIWCKLMIDKSSFSTITVKVET